MFPRSYFAPSFFAPSYWALGGGAGVWPPPRGKYRDRDVFDAIVRVLAGSQAFDTVIFGTTAELDRATADLGRVATVQPTNRFRVKGDGSNDRDLRTVYWRLTIKVQARTPDPQDAYAELDLLAAVCHNLLENASYGGINVAWLSHMAQGRIDNARFPELRYVADAEFSYVVDGTTGGLSQDI